MSSLSSSPIPDLPGPSSKAQGKKRALTASESDADIPLKKVKPTESTSAAISPSSSSTYDAGELLDNAPKAMKTKETNGKLTAVPNGLAHEEGSTTQEASSDSDDGIVIINSPRRKSAKLSKSKVVLDLDEAEADEDQDIQVGSTVKQNQDGEMTLAPFYSTTCPVCLGQPSPLVVTKCGHTLSV